MMCVYDICISGFGGFSDELQGMGLRKLIIWMCVLFMCTRGKHMVGIRLYANEYDYRNT